jgi:hypothetical protein
MNHKITGLKISLRMITPQFCSQEERIQTLTAYRSMHPFSIPVLKIVRDSIETGPYLWRGILQQKIDRMNI